MSLDPPVCHERWRPCYRLVPSRYPPVNLYEDVADPQDLEAAFAIEALTNPRLRDETGKLQLVPPEDRVSGPGTTPIMVAFTHLNPLGSRFSDGSYGVHYAGRARETAIRETVYHQEIFMRASKEESMDLDMRMYSADLAGEFHDLRKMRKTHTELYLSDDYSASQALGRRLRAQRSWGVIYLSVRHDGGQCVAVFRPPVLSPARQGPHYTYVWDGQRIVDVYQKAPVGIRL